jgi:hypothetical protein
MEAFQTMNQRSGEDRLLKKIHWKQTNMPSGKDESTTKGIIVKLALL